MLLSGLRPFTRISTDPGWLPSVIPHFSITGSAHRIHMRQQKTPQLDPGQCTPTRKDTGIPRLVMKRCASTRRVLTTPRLALQPWIRIPQERTILLSDHIPCIPIRPAMGIAPLATGHCMQIRKVRTTSQSATMRSTRMSMAITISVLGMMRYIRIQKETGMLQLDPVRSMITRPVLPIRRSGFRRLQTILQVSGIQHLVGAHYTQTWMENRILHMGCPHSITTCQVITIRQSGIMQCSQMSQVTGTRLPGTSHWIRTRWGFLTPPSDIRHY